MPTNTYESPLSSRYASDEMLYLFSADKKFSTWRRLWVALARAEMELGLPVTQEQVDELEAHITDIDYERAAQWEKKLRHDGKIYRISPWALTWDDENYYMIGYDSDENKIKHYRVDKMTKIQPTEEKRDGAEFFADFDMALYSKQTFGMYGGREETVTLRCENKLANVMIDKFGFDTAFSNITDTHFDMRVKVFVSPVFLTWIMNFGADVTVLSPESVKDELTALASDVLAQYK